MTNEAKTLLGIGLVTLVLFVGGIVALSKGMLGGGSGSSQTVADPSVLIRENSHTLQATDSKVTLVEFGDFQCPFCAQSHPVLQSLLAQYPDKITFVARHFPLAQHRHAVVAAEAAEAAGAQGKFWEMYDLLYTNQDAWESSSDALSIFAGYAQQLELDMDQYNKDMTDHTYLDKVRADMADGNILGVNSTPSFFVDGQRFTGSLQALITLLESKVQ